VGAALVARAGGLWAVGCCLPLVAAPVRAPG